MNDLVLYNNFNNLIKRSLQDNKPKESYPNNVNKAIKLVSVNKSYVIGSYGYKIQQYPADIDLIEEIKLSGSLKEILMDLQKKIMKIVEKIIKSPNAYIGELKAGIDDAYFIEEIGYIENGKIKGYNKDILLKKVNNLQEIGFLDENEYMIIIENAEETIDLINYFAINDVLRSHYILRWHEQDLINGYLDLIGNRRISFLQALSYKTMIKIDSWQFLNGRYTEVTNFFIVSYFDEKKKKHYLDVEDDFKDPKNKADSLLIDIIKLLYYQPSYNPFKAIKRMWSLARILDREDVLLALEPIITSEVSRASQIISELSTLIDILDTVKNPKLKNFSFQVNQLKPRITYLTNEMDIDEIYLFKIIDAMIHNKIYLHQGLVEIRSYLREKVNFYSINFLKIVASKLPNIMAYIENKSKKVRFIK